MKKNTHIRHTIRFRRWSRKAYATFASIGRCVTIGFLRKNVADSSLNKQKTTGTAKHTECSMEVFKKQNAKEWEADAGISQNNAAVFLIREQVVRNIRLHCFPYQTLCTNRKKGKAKKRIQTSNNNETRFTGSYAGYLKFASIQ